MAFKGKQSISEVKNLKYRVALKYKDQILDYYKTFEDTLTKLGNKK